MGFGKLILGESELADFEDLFIRDRIINRMHPDFSFKDDDIELIQRTRNKNKTRLLLSIMLFDKFDAVNMSEYDLSPLIDCGLIEEDACLVNGTSDGHPTSAIIDSVWDYDQELIKRIYNITESLMAKTGIEVYPKSFVKEEDTLNLCNAFILGSQQDFMREYEKVLRIILHNWYAGGFVYSALNLPEYEKDAILDQILYLASHNIDKLYCVLQSVPKEDETISRYSCLFEELESNIQLYYVPSECISCSHDWRICCKNSEFLYSCRFDCFYRESMGEQRYAKYNGLILSGENNAVLFDNSIRFRRKNPTSVKITEDIYHIVNIDLSQQVESLPVPKTAKEALRIRNRPEVSSLRAVLHQWGECLTSGNIDEAEYIKRDFDSARKYFEKKEMRNKKKKSFFHCFFEALGSQIPYLSNVVGIISPFKTRKKIIEEEKHRWFLLTR